MDSPGKPQLGAYGQSRKEQLKQHSAVLQAQRLQEIQAEQHHRHRVASDQKGKPVPQPKSVSPMKVAKETSANKAKITKLIEIRAGFYEAELLKELKIRKDDVTDPEFEAVYKEYQPAKLPRAADPHRSDSHSFDLSPRQTHSQKHSSTKESSESSSVRSSYKNTGRPPGQSKSFSSPMKAVNESEYEDKGKWNRSMAQAGEKALKVEQGNQTRRQRILEKSILDLDRKLEKLTAHKHSSSLSQVSKPPQKPTRLLRPHY